MLQGSYAPHFKPLADALSAMLARSPGGAGLCVYQHGVPVCDVWGGPATAEGEPWQHDTTTVAFSATKAIASTALHMLVGRGLLDHDDPVARHWPEFAQQGKAEITVRQALSHQAGLYEVRNILEDVEELLDFDRFAERLAAARPAHAPGKHAGYHALTYGNLIAEIVRRVSGQAFPDFVRQEIAAPLGLSQFWVGAPEDVCAQSAELLPRPAPRDPPRDSSKDGRDARQVTRARRGRKLEFGFRLARMLGFPLDGPRLKAAFVPRGIERLPMDSPEVLRACIPSVNGLFSAPDLARFYAALSLGGELAGQRLVSASVLREATALQVRKRDRVLGMNMGWRMGYHAALTSRGAPRHGFGHYGAGGSGGWAEPRRKLAFAFVTNTGLGSFDALRISRLSTVALRCARLTPRPLAGSVVAGGYQPQPGAL